MGIQLEALHYEINALEPFISANTMTYHYGKHHRAYVDNLNNLIKDSELNTKSLEEIILSSQDNSEFISIFNNAAQVWNHTFFWNSMTPKFNAEPENPLAAQIIKDFNDLSNFKAEFKKAGLAQFGSGWVWLTWCDGALKIVKTSNAQMPNVNQIPLITCDVWEHAYYLDYQNKRADFIDVFLNNLINWQFANQNFVKALAGS